VGLEIKGGNPLTENYSVLRPEVMNTFNSKPIAQKNTRFIEKLLKYDYIIIAGQAKSHCVAWTIDDLLTEINAHDPQLARKVYLLEDCSSAVVVPGVVDFTDQADAAFRRFKDAGMHVVRSTDPIDTWPDFQV
jgi:nicotinamidase-related amidase